MKGTPHEKRAAQKWERVGRLPHRRALRSQNSAGHTLSVPGDDKWSLPTPRRTQHGSEDR
jgi:hypothetical protein